jgi:mRNA-degrading endonuclease RelE of RelBE toxin-antitoxin system
MRRFEASTLAYTVDISPPAWNQLAHLSLESYRRIREELDAVAASLTSGGRRSVSQAEQGPGHPASTPSLTVDDAIAVYEVDHERRRVVLLEVAQRLPWYP